MFLSKRCLHGLRAILYLIIQPDDREWIPVREISDGLDIPFHFLTKILQDLAKAGLVVSGRGRSGGVRLGKPAAALTVLHVIETLEGSDFFHGCVLGFPQCNNQNPCALHQQWAAVRHEFLQMFSSETLADLSKRIHLAHLRNGSIDLT